MRIRVLHCPTDVGGNPQGLARAEREIGIESWSVTFHPSSFGYTADEVLWANGYNPLVGESKRWGLLLRALGQFDIIHFSFGLSIMPERILPNETLRSKHHWLGRFMYDCYARLLELRDLPWLKRSGKGIVVTYQGDDARQGDFCLANFDINPASEVEPGYYSAESNAHKRRKIEKFTYYADRIYALNPDLLNLLPDRAQFLPYAHIDLRDWRCPNRTPRVLDTPVIVHAPSHRGVKGTRYILEAVSRLKAEGVALEFVLVEGLSHAEARRIYEDADLLVDQLLCGWYGGLAVEFMALGKPVICYIRENDLRFIPEEMLNGLPVIRATPITVYDVLKEWLTWRRHELPEIGKRSRQYVENWHDPLKVGMKLKSEYEAIIASKRQGSSF